MNERSKSLGVLVALICCLARCVGQDTNEPIRITFDGPGAPAPGAGFLTDHYYEAGAYFRPTSFNRFARQASGSAGYPDNGTAYLVGSGATLAMNFTNGSVFNVISVDLAEYSTVVPDPVTVRFVGYLCDGTIVTNEFTTDGIMDGTGPLPDFQTFYFDSRFRGLDRLEIVTFGWTMDNLVLLITDRPPSPLVLGGVLVWGQTGFGQTNMPPGLTNVMAIAAGAVHSVALKNDGTVVAWGDNLFQQTNVPPGLSNVISIAAAGYFSNRIGHTLALKSDGTVVEWGDQTNLPTGLSNVVAIATGADHSLALTSLGTVAGWGYNNYGQSIGSSSSGLTNGFVVLGSDPVTNVVAISAGRSHSLALRNDGTVIGWGLNDSGQATGTPSATATNGFVWLGGELLSNVIAVAAGARHSVALKENGTVVAWGDGAQGQTNVPPGLSNVVAIAAGGSESLDYCLALTARGTVVAWGNAPALPAGLTNILAVAAGPVHSLALAGKYPRALRAQPSDLRWVGSGFSFALTTQSGRVYALQYSDDLSSGRWTTLPLVAGNGGRLLLTDTNATNALRLYRVLQW